MAAVWLTNVGRLPAGRILNAAGNAGPRRLIVLAAAAVAVLTLVAVVAMRGGHKSAPSHDTRLKPVDPLPGGLHSTPEQDALAHQADGGRAQDALQQGISFTPPMMPSVKVLPPAPEVEKAAPPADTVSHSPAFTGRATHISFPATAAPAPLIDTAAGNANTRAAETAYSKAIGDLFSQWSGRMPRTDIVLPAAGNGVSGNGADPPSPATSDRPAPPAPAVLRADPAEILIPAGRGVYAHPILAVNSDATSPVVLQADTGPIAGDRMIGTFAKQANRLVIHISTVIHQGQSINTDGVVVAPETMEAGVASGVDQHYLARFLLPAAAAFVQGLGQAIATTSNTATVLSPLGGAAYATHLNLNQQFGVAAGAAAGQIGTVLVQAAPKGPTISLDANVAVGVMFLSNVVIHRPG
jgi:intracellular multiplication protein IcmE